MSRALLRSRVVRGRTASVMLMLVMGSGGAAADAPSGGVPATAAVPAPVASPFSTYRPNYLILGPEDSDFTGNVTSKFQLSLRYDTGANWFFTYTQRSYWDITRDSTPALDHNFEPEVHYLWQPKSGRARDWNLNAMRMGFVHESNGRGGADSRAWNRAFVEPLFDWHGPFFEPRLWVITSKEDHNDDIEDYAGYADIVFGYQTDSGQRWTVTGRQGLEHGSVRLDLSLPMRSLLPDSRMRPYLYAQAWVGYGETLLYYNQYTRAFRIGIEFHP